MGVVEGDRGASPAPPVNWTGWRKRLFARLLAAVGERHDRAVAEVKRELLGGLGGTVVEIGPGAGVNLAYYGPVVRLLLIEPNPYLRRYLRAAAARLGRRIEFRPGTAEAMDLPDGCADAVVSTIVLCSVADPEAVLREVLRVLRPAGQFVFIEHVAAAPGTWLRRLQRWVRPVWSRIADGCHPDRDTLETVRRAGFAAVRSRRLDPDIPLPIVRPHVAGVAVKA